MRDLSLSEEFVVCLTGAKKSINFFFSSRAAGALTAAGLFDLEQAGVIAFGEADSITVKADLPQEFAYLQMLYGYLKARPRVDAKKTVRKFTAFSLNKGAGQIAQAIITRLSNEELGAARSSGIFSLHSDFQLATGTIDIVVDALKAEIGEPGSISLEATGLYALLKASKLDKVYLSKHERNCYEEKLTAITASVEGQRIVRLANHAEFATKMIIAFLP